MVNKDNLVDFIKPYYMNKDIMHNLSHIDRVLKYAEKLLKAGNYKTDADILMYAAYFHGFVYNSEQAIAQWLKAQGFSVDMINKIISAAWKS